MKKNSNFRSYSELSKLKTYKERFDYLKLDGQVGIDTFGVERYLNQKFYKSKEWLAVRSQVILRDSDFNNCYDMGDPNYPIMGRVIIHHINPIRIEDLSDNKKLLDPENLICVSHDTHNAIHYGSTDFLLQKELVERAPNDTCPWKGA